VKESLLARYGARIPEPVVIPVAVDATVPDPVRLHAHPFQFSLLTVGRLEPEKRIQDIIAALKLVVPKYPMVGLFVVGEGSERGNLEALVRAFGLEDHVLFLKGWRPVSEVRGMMQSAQAFIQASAYEGYGRTLLEAALAKVPIITTDVGIVGEVFKGYEDVLAVPVADPTALSLSIVGLIEDMSVRQELPRHAEAAARAHLASVGDIPARICEDLARTATVPT
jgi:glycosyltransferase involved in cell wall biosynthesis